MMKPNVVVFVFLCALSTACERDRESTAEKMKPPAMQHVPMSTPGMLIQNLSIRVARTYQCSGGELGLADPQSGLSACACDETFNCDAACSCDPECGGATQPAPQIACADYTATFTIKND